MKTMALFLVFLILIRSNYSLMLKNINQLDTKTNQSQSLSFDYSDDLQQQYQQLIRQIEEKKRIIQQINDQFLEIQPTLNTHSNQGYTNPRLDMAIPTTQTQQTLNLEKLTPPLQQQLPQGILYDNFKIPEENQPHTDQTIYLQKEIKPIIKSIVDMQYYNYQILSHLKFSVQNLNNDMVKLKQSVDTILTNTINPIKKDDSSEQSSLNKPTLDADSNIKNLHSKEVLNPNSKLVEP